jgi:HEAT repeat protein
MISTEELSAALQKLTDPDPGERRIAAEMLSEADERALYPLISALRDENPGVQDAAMRSIISIGGEVTAYMALPLLRESPFLRNTARIILRQIGQASVPLLRPLLTDKDDDVRTFAVDLISDIGWCDYPAEIARLLEADPNQNVRASAARAISILGFHEALPILVAALKDNEWVCFSVLESLALLRDESSIEPVLALLGSGSETLRYMAIETLGKIGSPRSSEALISRIPNASDIEKSAIIKSLVQIGITPSMAEVGDLLIEMYTKGEWEERLIALTGLADLKDKRAVPVILEVAGALDPSDPTDEERLIMVKQALSNFGCTPALIAALADPALKFRGKVIAVEVVGELGCDEAIPHLLALMDGDMREVRRAGVMALAEIRGEKALQEIRKCIEDRDGHVRRSAITVLGKIGDKASFPPLLSHLDVENYKDVLEENVKALLMIDPQALFSRMEKLSPAIKEMIARSAGNVDMLLALSRERDVSVRVAALASLGRLQNDGAYQRLSEALRDDNPDARKTAVMALGTLSRCFDDIIRIALHDTDLWVRIYAVKALGDSGNEGAAKSLVPLLFDKETPVVLAVIDALVRLGSADAVVLSALQNHPDAGVRERVAQIMEREP